MTIVYYTYLLIFIILQNKSHLWADLTCWQCARPRGQTSEISGHRDRELGHGATPDGLGGSQEAVAWNFLVWLSGSCGCASLEEFVRLVAQRGLYPREGSGPVGSVELLGLQLQASEGLAWRMCGARLPIAWAGCCRSAH